MADQIRYDLLTQKALRGLVRDLLVDVARTGLPGEHHFFITFDTLANGVKLSQRMRAQYPEEMTVVLQHQFWDLTVSDDRFEVGLSFNGIPERLGIPFDAIKGFFDPSVQFGLQFEDAAEQDGVTSIKPTRDAAVEAATNEPVKLQTKPARMPTSVPSVAPTADAPVPLPVPAASSTPDDDGDKPTPGGGEVVRLDRFRKK